MHYGACMINLTRLPPSKHVLWLSAPLISKIKKNSELWKRSSINLEKFLNHNKTNVSQKYFPTTFILVSPVLLAFITTTTTT
jgi:hypothetical protein